jgi:glycosyltransferase involved in cell wall biosynthesis
VPASGKLPAQIMAELAKQGVAVLEQHLGNRTAYASAFMLGLAVSESAPRTQAAAELRALAASVGVADRVRWIGDAADADLPAYLHAADIFVFPSNSPNEAFGLVLVEAMACGKPLIACDLPSGVPCVCQDGVNGRIVPPNDAKALANTLSELLSNDSLRRQLGEKGRELSRTEYSAGVMVERYWRLFHRLLQPVANP